MERWLILQTTGLLEDSLDYEAMMELADHVCADNGISYYYGPGTLTYVECVLIE